MKWLGQHIVDFIALFKSDVYFNGKQTFDGNKNVTPGKGSVIHVDTHDVTDANTSPSGTAAMYTHVNIEHPRLFATNTGVTTTAAASLYIKGSPVASTNQTITNAYSLWVDSGLVKFDGALTVGGAITGELTGAATTAGTVTTAAQPAIESIGTDGDTLSILGDNINILNTTTNKPNLSLINALDDSTGPHITLTNSKDDSDGEGNDSLGIINFTGRDSEANAQTYAQIYAQIDEPNHTEESGILVLSVANYDGGISDGLTLTGGSANNEIDVSIGSGANSVTTVIGTLTMGSTAALTNTGEVAVASQPNITTLAGVSSIGSPATPLAINSDTVTFSSANADDPLITIKNTSNSANDMARLNFVKDRGAAPAIGDNLAEIRFMGEDSNQDEAQYGLILCETDVVTAGQESGVIKFGVANHDGGNGYGLILTGGSEDNEVDVTLGLGDSSVVTVPGSIAGDLTGDVTGDVTGDLTGQAETVATIAGLAPNTATTQATQPNIDSIGTDGDTLNILADVLSMSNASATTPHIQLINSTDDVNAPHIKMVNQRGGSAGADGDDCGTMQFLGYDDQGTPAVQTYATILGEIHDATSGEESGRLTFSVANHDGGLGSGLVLTGGSVNDEVDVTIGLGVQSVVTIPGDLEVNGDNITFESSNADDPKVIIKNKTNDTQGARVQFHKSRVGGTTAVGDRVGELDFIGEDAADNTQHYGKIMVKANVVTEGQEGGQMVLQVATHDSSLHAGFSITGGSESGEVDSQIGLGANSVVTVPGSITIGSTGAIIGAGIPKVFGTRIKLIPSDFMANDDGGNTKFGVGYVEAAGAGYGMRPANNAVELYAFVSIPEGMKATHVDIYDRNDVGIIVYEAQINATTMVSKGTGNCNTTVDITDVAASSTNFLVIEVTTTSVNDRVFGGTVTIVSQ